MKDFIGKILLKFKFTNRLLDSYLFCKEYRNDKKFFKKHYSHSKETKEKLGYNIILITHSLEKGMSNEKIRRFGIEKVNNLTTMLSRYEAFDGFDPEDYYYINGINCLRSYIKCYEENHLEDSDEYRLVKDFITKRKDVKKISVGSQVVDEKTMLDGTKFDYKKFLASRKSIRNFSSKKVSDKDIEKAVEMAILSPSACNRQMCKVYHVADKKNSNYIINVGQGFGGFKKDTINILVITFDVNANYFVGERSQGWFNAGLFSMNLVNALHSLGIGSCFCQFGNSFIEEEQVKKELNIKDSERIATILAVGYYPEKAKIPYSPRKQLKDIYRKR